MSVFFWPTRYILKQSNVKLLIAVCYLELVDGMGQLFFVSKYECCNSDVS